HDLYLVLPLQARPEEFEARTMPVDRFWQQHLAPLDALFEEALVHLARHRGAIQSQARVGAFAAGPVAVAAFLPRRLFRGRRGRRYGGLSDGAILSGRSVRTQIIQADVHDSLQLQELAILTELPALPQTAKETLQGHVGKPFALVKLRTLPPRRRGAARPQATMPGIVLTFTQELVERQGALCYDYPLGTGRAWPGEIPLTQVYITAPEQLDLDVTFPRRPRTTTLPDYERNMAYLDESAAWVARGRQVHMARYDRANPAEDIRVVLQAQGESEFTVAARVRERRLTAARIGFPLLGALLWTAAFTLFVRRDRHARSLGFWRGLGKSWLFSSLLLLGPVLLAYSILWALSGTSLFRLLAESELTPRHVVPLVFVLVSLLLIAAGMSVLHRSRRSRLGSFLGRSLAAAIVSGAAYWLAGRALVEWLAG
ncbi:MAG: hypothetical protein MUQ65_11845, partial [Armatimonadetes bacterium]|nr:hypothetical protein [Armatimonadota bacterium]